MTINFWRDEVDIDTDSYISQGYVLHPLEDYTQPDNDPSDAFGHGTNVAGIAAAATDNGKGIAGVSWNCKIMPVRAAFGIKHPEEGWIGTFELDDLVRAFDWITNSNSAHIINMSFGTYDEDAALALFPSIASAYNADITLIAASGNENTTTRLYPAAFDYYVIAVGATDQSDYRCDPSDWGSGKGSNYGTWLDVVAPGVNLHSTAYNVYFDDHYYGSYYNGTSMSAPHVSGVAALMLSSNPGLKPVDIRNGIESTADKVTGMQGQNFHIEYGYGRLNAHKAVDWAKPQPPTNLYISGYQGGMPRISWTASISFNIDYYELWWWQYFPPEGWQLLTTTSATSWVDSRVTINWYDSEDEYCYKALAVNTSGLKSDFSNSDCVLVDESPPWYGKELAGELEAISETYALRENYPNPFNPITTIRYELPEESFVELRIFDIMGREIRRLVSAFFLII